MKHENLDFICDFNLLNMQNTFSGSFYYTIKLSKNLNLILINIQLQNFISISNRIELSVGCKSFDDIVAAIIANLS